jgi:hypothetical protein
MGILSQVIPARLVVMITFAPIYSVGQADAHTRKQVQFHAALIAIHAQLSCIQLTGLT